MLLAKDERWRETYLILRDAVDWQGSIRGHRREIQSNNDCARTHSMDATSTEGSCIRLTLGYDSVMTSIDIHRLVQRERDIAAIKRPIRRRVERGQGRLRQARHEFLDPANPHRSRSRVSRAGAVPEVQICGAGDLAESAIVK